MTVHVSRASGWTVATVSYASPDACRLTSALHAEQAATYGYADDPASTPAQEFDPPAGAFLIVTTTTGGPAIACGGWRSAGPRTAEVKRMYVSPAHRGQGLGRLLLRAIERDAAARGHAVMILETGSLNNAALGLYTASGFTPTGSYAPGRDPSINRAMRKSLLA